jgi:hypothetical protein
VGTLLDRLRLHLGTARFLARRRRDLLWEAGCDYADLVVARLRSQLSTTRLEMPLPTRMAPAERLAQSARKALFHLQAQEKGKTEREIPFDSAQGMLRCAQNDTVRQGAAR